MFTVPLKRIADERGAFCETFRQEWFPWIDWSRTQHNRSDSKAGVLRGLHYHLRQVDYWLPVSGRLRVGLADLRAESPTFKNGATLDIDADDGMGLFIPTGVAHGFCAITDVTLIYVVNNYYDGSDERGIQWDDAEFAVPWGITAPVLSARDKAARPFAEISAEELPG